MLEKIPNSQPQIPGASFDQMGTKISGTPLFLPPIQEKLASQHNTGAYTLMFRTNIQSAGYTDAMEPRQATEHFVLDSIDYTLLGTKKAFYSRMEPQCPLLLWYHELSPLNREVTHSFHTHCPLWGVTTEVPLYTKSNNFTPNVKIENIIGPFQENVATIPVT